MKNDYINYQELIEESLVEVIKKTLKKVERFGLSGNHHFYITLKTKHPLTKLPEFLKQKYPDTITIVLEHEFSNLHVSDTEFAVTLKFNNKDYYIHIPFDSITNFSDPSCKFNLEFSIPNTKIWEDFTKDQELGFINDEEKIVLLDDFRKR